MSFSGTGTHLTNQDRTDLGLSQFSEDADPRLHNKSLSPQQVWDVVAYTTSDMFWKADPLNSREQVKKGLKSCQKEIKIKNATQLHFLALWEDKCLSTF